MRRKVKITNSTDFDSRTIRKIVLAVAQRFLKPSQYPKLEVTVGHPKRTYVTGNAVVNPVGATASIGIFIPKTQTDVVEVCNRVKVCFDYVLGKHGGTLGTLYRDWHNRPGHLHNFPFAKKLILSKQFSKQKMTGAVASMRKAEMAQDRVHIWEKKFEHAKRMLKKWQRLLRYHANRGDKLHAEEAARMEKNQGMTVEDFLKIPPVQIK